MAFGKTTPILRIFDEAKAKEFYIDFLWASKSIGSIVSKTACRYICKSRKTAASSTYQSIMETVVPARQ